MTPDITDQDEREAIEVAQKELDFCEARGLPVPYVTLATLRALLHRATRAHD